MVKQIPTIAGSAQAAWFRALDHARLTGVKPFWRKGDYYTVTSPRQGDTYTVRRVVAGRHITYSCTCPAATGGKVCWHRALVAALPFEVALRTEWRTTAMAGCQVCGDIFNDGPCDHCDSSQIPVFLRISPLADALR